MMDALTLLPIIDFCILQGFSGGSEEESQADYRLRVSGKLLPGLFARSGLVALGFHNYLGPRILALLPEAAREGLLAHPRATRQGDGLRLATSASMPSERALHERAELNELVQRLKLVRELQGDSHKLASVAPRWWRAPAAGLLLTKLDPALRKVLSALEGSQKKAVAGLEVAQQVLPFAALAECRIQDCRFTDADLSHATLSHSVFRDCDFTGAKLIGVEAQNATLADSSFVRANLSHADLSHANLAHSRFDASILEGARLCEAGGLESATSAVFDDADASGLKLGFAAVLDDASFRGADLRGADLSGASLKRVDFSGAKLQRAAFRNANLAQAIFTGADLSEAVFEGAVLDGIRS